MCQVRGPLTALRTLGSILVPRLLKKEGQEIDRDVAQGILTQVCIRPWALLLVACFTNWMSTHFAAKAHTCACEMSDASARSQHALTFVHCHLV